jgi:SpoU rRNA methylase family enzyme
MIEEAIDTRSFRFSAILDEAYQDMLPTLLELEDRLNEDIQLSDYTDAIETIYFTPMILEDQTGYEERLEYDEKAKEVFLQVFASDEDEFSELLAASLLCLQKTLEEELINEDFANALNVGNNPDKR